MHSSLRRRQFLLAASSTAAAASVRRHAQASDGGPWDMIVVGGGTAGLPAGIFGSRRGARVLILEASYQIGGTLFLSTGQMSAAGTRLQKEKGIADTAEKHYDDVMRISRGTADKSIVRLATFNAADTFDWLLENGLKPLPEHPVFGLAHEPYQERRYAWGPEGGMSILEALEPQVKAAEATGRLSIRRGMRARELLLRNGAVIGVRAEDDSGKMHDITGNAVVLASGGYAMNHALYEELTGVKHYAKASYPYSQGDGILMALAAGGYVRGRENYLPSFGQIMSDADVPSVPFARFTTYPERRQPWEIYVNVRGERFVREDVPSVDVREHALLKQPDLRYWVVFDQAILDAAPLGVEGWDKSRVMEAFAGEPMFKSGATLAELARNAGIDADGLARTVAAYNAAQAAGKDPAFGRVHMPLPVAKGPFYAIRVQGMNITTTVGVGVDDDLRVTRKDGRVIPGLYAAGEILGAGQLMGNAVAGGMMVTPALTFGRLLGQRLVPLKS